MNRLPSIDILRVATVAMIVYRHTYGASDLMILSVGVPFFFFLTGWLWTPGKRDASGELDHRWHTLGIPYLSWLIVLSPIFLLGYYVQDKLTWETTMSGLFGGSYAEATYNTFWFISALFFVGVLMRFFDNWKTVPLILAGLVLLATGVFGPVLAILPLSVGVAIPSLAFAILGRVFRSFTAPGKNATLTAAATLAFAVPLTLSSERLDIKFGDFGTPLLSGLLAVLIIWAVLVLLDAGFRALPDKGSRLAQWLGPVTAVAIMVVLTHPVILWGLGYFYPDTLPAWAFPVALITPWIAALVIDRTPLARFLVGRPATTPAPAVGQFIAR